MIVTSCYQDWKSDKYRTIDISGYEGANVNYKGEVNTDLVPKKEMLELWERCRDIPNYDDRNNSFYIKSYYYGVLAKLDPQQVLYELNNSVLLCHEPNSEFSHRHIIAAWLEILLNEEVVEAKCNGDKIRYLERPPFYEKIKKELETVMRQKDMHGFRSLRACYLYEQSEKANLHFQEFLKGAIDFEQTVGKEALQFIAIVKSKQSTQLLKEANLAELEYCNSPSQLNLHQTNPKYLSQK